MWNNESNSYETITIRDEKSLEDINTELYKNVDRLYFRVDSVYYKIKILDEYKYTYEIIDSETFPSKPTDTIENRIIIVASKFFSKENLKSTLQDLQVWIVSIAIAATMVIVQLIQYNLRRSENIDSDEAQDAISEYNKKVKIKPVNFPEYIAENNRNEKIKVFRAHIQSQLYKVRKKILSTKKTKVKEIELLKLEKEELESYLTPEFIEENIDSISIKYDKLHAENYVYNSYERNNNFRKDYSSENVKVSTMATKKILTSLVMATLISAISLQLYMNFSFNGGFWVIMISTLLSMAMTSFNARKSADSIYRTDILGVINNKSLILEDAIKWALIHPTKEKSYEMLLDDYYKEKLHEESDKIKQSYQDKFNSLSEEIKKIRNS